MNKGTAIVGFFMSFVAGMFLMWGLAKSGTINTSASLSPDKDSGSLATGHQAAKIPVGKNDPTWGDANAPVTIVEISDFQCPFCSRVNPTMAKIKATYGKEKVRIVWKHHPLPFHKNARPAHDAAATVFGLNGSDAFWKFHDLAFKNQKALTAENIEKWAVESGADAAQFKKALADKKFTSKVDQDIALAKKIGAGGTPAFRINGISLSGAQPFDKFKAVIDAQLAEAKKLEAAGTKKSDIYVKLTDKNFKGSKSKAAKDPKKDDKTIWRVPVDKNDPIKGAKDALVTIVEWSDFQCPYCKRVGPTLKKVEETYGKDVRIIWKDNPLPFHKQAEPAATLARVARKQQGDAGFWKAHDTLFDKQSTLKSEEGLIEIAKLVGVSWSDVSAAISGKTYADLFDAGRELATDLQARGTPHFFVNGQRVSGAQPFEKFKEIIDEQLAVAKKVAAKGIPRDQVYAELMKSGKAPPPPEQKKVPAPPADSPFVGGKNAKVVIQEWSDFQCPFCKRVNPTIAQIKKEFGDQVKIVWRHLPPSLS